MRCGGWVSREELIPRGLKERYLAQPHRVGGQDAAMVISDEPHIPWELVWPHDIVTGAIATTAPWSVSCACCMGCAPMPSAATLYAGPAAALPFQAVACGGAHQHPPEPARNERTFVLGLLRPRGGRDASPACRTARVPALLRGGGYDWLHVVTTASRPAAGDARRHRVEDDNLWPDDLIDPDVKRHIGATNPASCSTSATAGRQVWGSHLGGWATPSSAPAPAWSPRRCGSDDRPPGAAPRPSTRLLTGDPVAESHAARLAARNGDPTWLAYSVYAHPPRHRPGAPCPNVPDHSPVGRIALPLHR